MRIIEILIMIFAVFAFVKTILKLKDNAISWKGFCFWTLVWTGLIVLVLFRKKIGGFGIDDPFKTVVMISVIVLFYLMFRMFIKIDKVEQEITKVTREIAVKKAGKR